MIPAHRVPPGAGGVRRDRDNTAHTGAPQVGNDEPVMPLKLENCACQPITTNVMMNPVQWLMTRSGSETDLIAGSLNEFADLTSVAALEHRHQVQGEAGADADCARHREVALHAPGEVTGDGETEAGTLSGAGS